MLLVYRFLFLNFKIIIYYLYIFIYCRNSIYIDSVHSEDRGDWAVNSHYRKSSNTDNPRAEILLQSWCNFTLRVLEDHEEALPRAHQLQTILKSAKLMERFQHDRLQKEIGPPKFKRLDKMKGKRFVTVAVGKSVVFKCPAYGS